MEMIWDKTTQNLLTATICFISLRLTLGKQTLETPMLIMDSGLKPAFLMQCLLIKTIQPRFFKPTIPCCLNIRPL